MTLYIDFSICGFSSFIYTARFLFLWPPVLVDVQLLIYHIFLLHPYDSQRCNMDRAESLVREMEEEGIDVPIDIYHTMMDGYTIIGNEEKCLVVFERLKVSI